MTPASLDPASAGFRRRRSLLIAVIAILHGAVLHAGLPHGDGRVHFAETEITVTTESVEAVADRPEAASAVEARPDDAPAEPVPVPDPSVAEAETPPEPIEPLVAAGPVEPPPIEPLPDEEPPTTPSEPEPLPATADPVEIHIPPPPSPESTQMKRPTEPSRSVRKAEPVRSTRSTERRASHPRPATTGAITGPATAGSAAARAGADPGYGARVRAMLQARVDGLDLEEVEGAVGVTFTIGPTGAVASHGLSRPSGVGVIDRSIAGLLGRMRYPPPPGGHFAASVTIRVR